MGLIEKWRKEREKDKENKEDEQLYGGIGEWILARFGITEEHMELVKSLLDSVEKTDRGDSVEYNIKLKNIKVTVSK